MVNSLSRLEIMMIAGPLIMLLVVLELVRRRKLREDYSLLWLVTFVVIIVLAFLEGALDRIAIFMGIFYPPTALFVIGFGLMLIILLQYSTVITRLASQNKQSAQQIALLSQRVHELENQLTGQDRA